MATRFVSKPVPVQVAVAASLELLLGPPLIFIFLIVLSVAVESLVARLNISADLTLNTGRDRKGFGTHPKNGEK